MTSAAANAVMDRLETDDAFAELLKNVDGPEAGLEILRAEGFDVTQSEIRDVLIDRYGDELTQEQLDALAGGVTQGEAIFLAVGLPVAVGVAALAV